MYEARKLRHEIETRNRQRTLESSSGSAELNTLDEHAEDGSVGDSRDKTSVDVTKKPPKSVYKKIQRSHSSTNNYEQVSELETFASRD